MNFKVFGWQCFGRENKGVVGIFIAGLEGALIDSDD